jgi:hypothetical protein
MIIDLFFKTMSSFKRKNNIRNFFYLASSFIRYFCINNRISRLSATPKKGLYKKTKVVLEAPVSAEKSQGLVKGKCLNCFRQTLLRALRSPPILKDIKNDCYFRAPWFTY